MAADDLVDQAFLFHGCLQLINLLLPDIQLLCQLLRVSGAGVSVCKYFIESDRHGLRIFRIDDRISHKVVLRIFKQKAVKYFFHLLERQPAVRNNRQNMYGGY